MDHSTIKKLLIEVQASLDVYQSDPTDTSRVEAQEKALKLARALEKPRDAILKIAYSPTVVMAVKVAHDLNVFPTLANATSPVPLNELAVLKPADPLLVERMMRLLVAHGFAEEPEPCEYLPTALSKEMTQRTSIGVVESLFLEFLPGIQKVPEYLQVIGYKSPEDPLFAPLQYAHNFKQDGFAWLCENPAALTRFNAFMEGQRADRPHWADWFPIPDQILASAHKGSDGPLLVDIGGGRGHDLLGFKQRFPEAPGKLVLEDLPTVIEEARSALDLEGNGIDAVGYDFFAQEQPIKGARVYYFRNIFHDWSDDKARLIIKNLVPAMERGYSKVLMEEYIIPDKNARALEGMTDIAVMVFCSGLERTRQRFTNLLESAGLKVTKFWTREGDGQGIIEAELA
ncbi:S-adenosyl-L-methionine-dependent methyltransferase [Aspergillus minisclerotigenes]|uniref:S-adenosyl-L-methionine-dependent methyltransferase n=1 Tax=Aspergillus minisclerotigenes TaxID=656917 RepID=A0A5N6J0B0_9EURO|nr:S-adenosyl-L-methionine-dependent methyltransferase [Aspergillus minisclerotigenes]